MLLLLSHPDEMAGTLFSNFQYLWGPITTSILSYLMGTLPAVKLCMNCVIPESVLLIS